MNRGDASKRLARLIHYLIAKSIIEALFVGALAVGFYLMAFTPSLRGELDEANAQHVAGWAVDHAAPQAHVEVQLYLDGNFIASRKADDPRPDVKAAGLVEDELHGYNFVTPPLGAGEHLAQVYAVHESGGGARRTMQLVGKPLRFRVGGS
jgi:hypothetical protein